jgi:hypothetical protein
VADIFAALFVTLLVLAIIAIARFTAGPGASRTRRRLTNIPTMPATRDSAIDQAAAYYRLANGQVQWIRGLLDWDRNISTALTTEQRKAAEELVKAFDRYVGGTK